MSLTVRRATPTSGPTALTRAEILGQPQLAQRGFRFLPFCLSCPFSGWHLEGHLQLQPRGRCKPRKHLGIKIHPFLWRHGAAPGDALVRGWGRIGADWSLDDLDLGGALDRRDP